MTLSQPTTLRLKPEQELRLRNVAKASGLTVSETVRRVVSSGLTELEEKAVTDERLANKT